MTSWLTTVIVLGLSTLISAVAPGPKSTAGPLSPDAKAAISTCERKEREAQKAYEAAVVRSREEVLASLKVA